MCYALQSEVSYDYKHKIMHKAAGIENCFNSSSYITFLDFSLYCVSLYLSPQKKKRKERHCLNYIIKRCIPIIR